MYSVESFAPKFIIQNNDNSITAEYIFFKHSLRLQLPITFPRESSYMFKIAYYSALKMYLIEARGELLYSII